MMKQKINQAREKHTAWRIYYNSLEEAEKAKKNLHTKSNKRTRTGYDLYGDGYYLEGK